MEEKTILEYLFDDEVEFADAIPLKPTGPSTYVMASKVENTMADGWKWKPGGSCKLPRSRPLYRKSVYYYHGRDGVEKTFQRLVYQRLDSESRVLIRYVGEPTCMIPAAHGNSQTDRPFIRTNPAVLAKIKEVVSAADGKAGPAKLYKEYVRTVDTDDPRNCPRDLKQVCNAVQSVRDSGRAVKDGITNVARRLMEVDYIHVLEVTRDNLCTVVGLLDMVNDFKELHRGEQSATVYYDTTFTMGDFYVSALLYRHSVFDGSPVMPLLMLIHERRTTESHELLFKWFTKLTGINSVVCVADREMSITKAVMTTMPKSKMVYCWNHIIGDARAWVRSNGGTAADESFYSSTVRDLLNARDEQHYQAVFSDLCARWSKAFVDYYCDSLQTAVLASAEFSIAGLGLVSVPYVGITNNVSESYNRVLKDFQNWKERPIDIVVDGFIHLQQFHIREIARGLAGAGMYRLRPGFPAGCSMPLANTFIIEPHEIVSTLQQPASKVNCESAHSQSTTVDECQSDLVHAQLLTSRVKLHEGVWLVDDNVRMHDTFMVKLSNGSCSCGLPGCIHLMAVRLAAGLGITKTRKHHSLSALRRKNRAGRKQGRKRGLDTVEMCAPDSVKAMKTSVLSPVLEEVQLENAAQEQATQQNGTAENTSTNKKKCCRPLFDELVPVPSVELTSNVTESEQLETLPEMSSCSEDPSAHVEFVDVRPLEWSPDKQASAADIEQSPGEACAIMDVESGKSPASLVGTSGRWLTGCDVDHVQSLLKTQWNGDGFESVTSDFQQPMRRPFIQVLFSPVRQHWMTVYGAAKSVIVYDSLSGGASQQTRATVRTLAGKRIRVSYSSTCTQQTLPGDCGCFALAYATTLVLGGDPGSYELVPEMVRSHLALIVRRQQIETFPHKLHCYCQGQAGGRMVACDSCDAWFHIACLSRAVSSDSWLCRNCV